MHLRGLDQVIEAMVDVVLVVDVAGQIQRANTAAETASGYTRAELATLGVAELLVDDHSGIRTAVRERIREGAVLRRVDSWLVTKAGAKIPVSVTAAPIFETDGPTATGIVVVARDISELQQEIVRREAAEVELRKALASIEERLEQARAQLLTAERRATLGTLAGGVGHELRNIAQIHVLAVETIGAELDLSAEAKQAVADLERAGEHVAMHAQRLLQLARPGPDHARPLGLETVIREVVAMLRGAGKLRDVEVVLALGDGLVTVSKPRIEQILVNLIVNAVDAMGGGKILIATRTEEQRVVVEVTDSGPGMAPEVLARVFEPFFTTKADGTGLGLPVVREIVESYGGVVSATSTPGIGTTFKFDLPLSSR